MVTPSLKNSIQILTEAKDTVTLSASQARDIAHHYFSLQEEKRILQAQVNLAHRMLAQAKRRDSLFTRLLSISVIQNQDLQALNCMELGISPLPCLFQSPSVSFDLDLRRTLSAGHYIQKSCPSA